MICVLTPVHNCERFILPCLRSVLEQQVRLPISIIVVDDGSTDQTPEKIASLGSPLISVVSTVQQGVSVARNHLLRLVPPEAQFVTFIDADDIMPEGRLARDIALLEADPDLALVYGAMAFFDKDSIDTDGRPAPYRVVRTANLAAGTYRADVLRAVGPFDESFEHGEDLDFLLRMFETSPKHMLLDEISMYYRQHEDNMTKRKDALRRGIMKAMLRHAQRRRANASLRSAEGIFESQPVLGSVP